MISRRELDLSIGRAAVRRRTLQPAVRTIGAPVGGWNVRDSVDDMPEIDAIVLDNFDPGFGKVDVRRGSSVYATLSGVTSAVETVAELHTSSGRFLVAAADGKLWDATDGGTIASELASGFSNDRWQVANMNDKLGLVNGEDAPQEFNGTAVSAMTISGTGLTTTNLVGIHVFKARSYFWEENSQDFWYSSVNTLGGALTVFPLADVGSFGGHLVAMTTWTRDGGSGLDDLAVFAMSSGEVIVYQGSNPGDANAWSLVGVFRIGGPVNIRALTKAGGDVLIVTSDGYTQLSKVLQGVRGRPEINISDKIGPEVRERIDASGTLFGWDVLHYPRGRRLMINYPRGGSFEQHVVNLQTGAWTRFKGMNARCWTLFEERPFFGGASGQIWQADTGSSDGGKDIMAHAQQAFTYLGSRARNKQVQMLRPLLEGTGAVPVRLGLAVDFDPLPSTAPEVVLGTEADEGAEWDIAEWDVASWGATEQTIQAWLARTARGYAISPILEVRQNDHPIRWSALTYSYTGAGAI